MSHQSHVLNHLNALERLFPGFELTLICRNKDPLGQPIFISKDDPVMVLDALERAKTPETDSILNRDRRIILPGETG